MTPDRYQKVKAHFYALVELDGGGRAAGLHAIEDDALRADVQALLDNVDADFLEQSAIDELAPRQIGPYHIERELGRGGMGVVYLATRDDEFRQRVALKLIKRGIDTEAVVNRFRRERQILATLEHPNIARLLDGGSTRDGRPYFVMEYVDGQRIDTDCRMRDRSAAEIVRMFRDVCGAVQHAHQKLIVHRDLKPGNILVTPDGVPKLLDFGVAKLLADEQGDGTALTAAGVMPLTPDYASPEQLRGDPISSASDVYSLGVVLYELLTGVLPFDLRGRTPEERAQTIGTTEPRRPATLSGDLDTILLMALRRDPGRRYPSVAEFSADLGRWLDGFPVHARPDTLTYRLTKFASRNRAGLALTAMLVLALGAGVTATVYEANKARIAQARAERRSRDVRHLAASMIFQVHDAIAHLEGATEARGIVVRSAISYFDDLARESGDDPTMQRDLARAYVKLGSVLGQGPTSSLGDYNGAFRKFDKAIEIQTRLLSAHPEDLELQNDLATSYDRIMELGVVRPQVHVDMALRNVALRERMLARRPNDLAIQRGLGLALERVSDFYGNPYWGNIGQPSRGIPYAERGIAVREMILRRAPADVISYLDLADSHTELAAVLWTCGRNADALAHELEGQKALDAAASRFPTDSEVRRNIYTSQVRITRYLEGLGRHDEAMSSARRSLAGFERLAAADPKNALVKGQRVASMLTIARILRETGRTTEALQWNRDVLRTIESTPVMHTREPRKGDAELSYAHTLAALHDEGAAEEHCRKAIPLLGSPQDWWKQVDACILLGDLVSRHDATAARGWYERARAEVAPLAAGDPQYQVARLALDEATARLH